MIFNKNFISIVPLFVIYVPFLSFSFLFHDFSSHHLCITMDPNILLRLLFSLCCSSSAWEQILHPIYWIMVRNTAVLTESSHQIHMWVSSFYQLIYAQSNYVTLIRLLNVLADVMAGKFHVSKTKNFQCGKMYELYSYYSMHNFAPYH